MLCQTAFVQIGLAQTASDPPRNTGVAPAARSAPARLVLAQDLFALGSAQGDALTVLAAARLAASVDAVATEPVTLDPSSVALVEGDRAPVLPQVTRTGPTGPLPVPAGGTARPAARATFFTALSDAEGAAIAPVAPDAMFAQARKLSGDDDALLALIDDALADRSSDRVGTAFQRLSPLGPGQTDVWEIAFPAGARAEIAVIGDGDTALSVLVTDPGGVEVCVAPGGSDRVLCTWSAGEDGFYLVTVRNPGAARNSYVLVTD